jgi:hypothetical protein
MIYVILVWFAVWLYKNFKQTSVKGHFKKLLAQSKLGFSKIEFELFGLRDERENLRKEFDRLNETIDAFNVHQKGIRGNQRRYKYKRYSHSRSRESTRHTTPTNENVKRVCS